MEQILTLCTGRYTPVGPGSIPTGQIAPVEGIPMDFRAPAAVLESAKSGVRMEVETTLPGIQFYAGNYMAGCPAGKDGAKYDRRDAVRLETQFFPDTPNHPEFPRCVFRPGEAWEHETVFRCSRVGEL